ncbi:2-dehydropantoate 2-reductase [Patellaria atrata CBS 101060]|uniref:2-dehydropantoate 2-reductase n=1 Tax=Patellaria atrata CBS 101060 TaxID=1346257 RepID=A0A9P4VQD3_9PEZI|nr:2-dehydropantoate 2-reductase [Patellaria atrata CBS 101060]
MMPRVLIFGTGGIGSAYTYALTQAGADVTAVCRSNYEAVKARGLAIDSIVWGHDLHVHPNVARTCLEAAQALPEGEIYDYIVVTSKAFPASKPSTADNIKPAVGKGTTIVIIQNGIRIEQEYSAAFPDNPIISCVVYLPVTQTEPGIIKMLNLELLEMGSYPQGRFPEAPQAFAELLGKGNATAKVYEDIQPRRWSKLLVNCAWNPICALTLGSDVEFLTSSKGAEDFVFSVMMEVVAIAKTLGYGELVNEKEARRQLDRAVARVQSNLGYEASMLADVRNGRRMEVEAILGGVVKIGKEKGVVVEKLSALYTLATALDSNIQRCRKD